MEADIATMILNIESNEQLCQFLHSAIDEQVGKPCSNLGRINNDVDWSEENQAMARKYFQNLFKNASMDEDYKISDAVSELGSEKIQCVEECYAVRKPEILRILERDILAEMDDPIITDFDWKIKWIRGSSSSSSIQETVSQVDFHNVQMIQNKRKRKLNTFEMNKNELNNFIKQLQNALSKFDEH